MYIIHISEVSEEQVDPQHARKVAIRWLLSQEIGVPNFEMRYFEIEKGGYTTKDKHPFEHEVFVVQGTGAVIGEEGARKLKSGDALYIAPDEIHQFRNDDEEAFSFICLIPKGVSRTKKRSSCGWSVKKEV
jgi:quercetin dioxygenase-like cupin family protein